jgi:hypothetical protein
MRLDVASVVLFKQWLITHWTAARKQCVLFGGEMDAGLVLLFCSIAVQRG